MYWDAMKAYWTKEVGIAVGVTAVLVTFLCKWVFKGQGDNNTSNNQNSALGDLKQDVTQKNNSDNETNINLQHGVDQHQNQHIGDNIVNLSPRNESVVTENDDTVDNKLRNNNNADVNRVYMKDTNGTTNIGGRHRTTYTQRNVENETHVADSRKGIFVADQAGEGATMNFNSGSEGKYEI